MKKLLLVLMALPSMVIAQTTNLLLSEYGEGSGGNKKYIEIYNGTGATVSLADYQIWKSTNGGGWSATPLALTGTLSNGSTYVIANNSGDVIGADLYNTFISFNGDDAIGLAWNGGSGTTFSVIDVFGVPDVDPGTGWDVAGVTNGTVDKILIRKPSVCSPTTNWTLSSGTDATSSQWIISVDPYNATTQTTDLGMHTANCGVVCNSTATLTITNCNSYTVPSGDETYTVSGTYYDTIQNNAGCDSLLTINLTITSSITYYADADNDGYGDPNTTTTGCTLPTGYVTNSDDCDDANAAVGVATTVFYIDADNDGYGSADSTVIACVAPTGFVSNNLDCNDTVSTIHPGATEIMDNGIDEDCDGYDLESIGSIIGQYEFTGVAACPVTADTVTVQPTFATFSTFTSDSTTCASASNVFNNSGWNTDSIIDLIEYNQFYVNAEDCYSLELNRLIFTTRISSTGGTPTVILRSSLDNFTTDLGYAYPTSSYLTDTVDLPAAFDAVDSVAFRFYVINMGSENATFRMDNVKLIGNYSSVAPQTYFADADADGYGNPADSVVACSAPTGYVTDNTDCDDNDAAVNPAVVWYQDADNDGFGDVNNTTTGCTAPTGYVADSTDCDDASATVYPGAAEIADNGIDENCDGVDGYLGINDLSVNSFEVYPNPSTGMFTVVVKNEGSAIVSLVNLNGQLLKSFTSNASECVVDATDLANGTYLMLVKSANGITQKRIVVQH